MNEQLPPATTEPQTQPHQESPVDLDAIRAAIAPYTPVDLAAVRAAYADSHPAPETEVKSPGQNVNPTATANGQRGQAPDLNKLTPNLPE